MAKKHYTQHTHPGLTISAFFVTLIVIFGCVLGGMQLWGKDKIKPSNWGKNDTPAIEQEADEGMTINPDEQAPGTAGISFVVTDIPREKFAAYGIAPIAETAKQVTATVTPQGAEDAVLDWSVAWKEGTSGKWGNGKTVTEYVTVAATSDGALTANVSCTQAFGEQVIVTAAIRGNADVKGTCTVDYQQKYNNAITGSIAYVQSTAGNITWTLGSTADVTVDYPGYAKSVTELQNYYATAGSNKGTYTVSVKTALTDVYTVAAEVKDVKIELAPTADYIAKVKAASGTISATAGTFTAIGGTGTGANATITNFDFVKALLFTGSSMNYTNFKRDMSKASTAMLTLRLSSTVNGAVQTKAYNLKFTATSFGKFASGVTVVEPSITF